MTVSAISSDEVHALEELKEANEIATSSLQNDLTFLQTRHKNLEVDHDQTRSHLIEALLAKDNITKELAILQEGKPESKAEAEKTKTTLQALKEVSYKMGHSKAEISPKRHKLLSSRPHISFQLYGSNKSEAVKSTTSIDNASRGSSLYQIAQDWNVGQIVDQGLALE
jgi:hypothetical protein